MLTEKPLKILILGGTKDSTNLIKLIKENIPESYILTTTTTEYGSKLAKESGSDDTISRPLPKNEIIEIINKNDFNILIDATHPFATHITKTATEISEELGIKFIRFERPGFDFSTVDCENIFHVSSFVEAGLMVSNLGLEKENILHFAGANTMEDVLKNVNTKYFYPRVLNVKSSVEKCEELGIPSNHVLFMSGVSSKEENINLINKYCAKAIITKESGDTGGIYEKISAANELNIKIILVDRPKIDGLKEENIVNDLDMIINILKKI